MEFTQVISQRYSCKAYNGEPLKPEALAAILEAGRLAPTAKNLQGQHIFVIQSAEGLAKVDAATPCRYNAPVVLAVAYDRGARFTYPGGRYDSGSEDAAIVASHMMLAAANEGVNSCWVNFFDPDKLAPALGIPEDEQLVMLLDLGYASEKGVPLANHGSRKSLCDTVKFI